MSKRKILSAILYPALSLLPPKKGVTVLTLHNIYPQDYLWFEHLIEKLAQSYEFLDPSNLNGELRTPTKFPKILLTFDDGFHSNKILAERILAKYGVKAIFFITEGFIGIKKDKIGEFIKNSFYPKSKNSGLNSILDAPMSWTDVRWLAKNGHVIGAHTKTHPSLSKLISHDSLIEEIVISADSIEGKIGAKINCFAFPFGTLDSVNKDAIDLAKKRFEFVFSNIRGSVSESPGSHFIFRQNIVPNDPIWLVRMVIEGKLDWKYAKLRKLAKSRYQI